jgi:hypothetical protein
VKVLLHIVIVALLLLPLASAQVPKLSPFSADIEMSSTSGNRGPIDITGRIYVASEHMRVNVDKAGQQTAVITDFASKKVNVLMVQQRLYMEHTSEMIGRGPNLTRDLRPYDPENPCANQPDVTCKKIGVEKVDDRARDHWEFTDKNGKVANIWIDQKLRFPIKLVSPDSTVTLTNISEGEPDASLFQIPPDYQKMSIVSTTPQGSGAPPQQ